MKKTYSSSFKGKVALEACIGISTVAQIAGKYQIHPNQVQQWKKKLQSDAGLIFETNAERKAKEDKNYTEDCAYPKKLDNFWGKRTQRWENSAETKSTIVEIF